MSLTIMRLLGERFAHKTLAQHSHTGGLLDIKLGFSMLKDRRVPFRPKLLSVGLGAGLIALLIGLEFPLESLLALVPGVGLVLDITTDAMEAILGTAGVAAILLPHLAPKLLTMQIRNERTGIIEADFSPTVPTAAPILAPVRPTYDLPEPIQQRISPQR